MLLSNGFCFYNSFSSSLVCRSLTSGPNFLLSFFLENDRNYSVDLFERNKKKKLLLHRFDQRGFIKKKKREFFNFPVFSINNLIWKLTGGEVNNNNNNEEGIVAALGAAGVARHQHPTGVAGLEDHGHCQLHSAGVQHRQSRLRHHQEGAHRPTTCVRLWNLAAREKVTK